MDHFLPCASHESGISPSTRCWCLFVSGSFGHTLSALLPWLLCLYYWVSSFELPTTNLGLTLNMYLVIVLVKMRRSNSPITISSNNTPLDRPLVVRLFIFTICVFLSAMWVFDDQVSQLWTSRSGSRQESQYSVYSFTRNNSTDARSFPEHTGYIIDFMWAYKYSLFARVASDWANTVPVMAGLIFGSQKVRGIYAKFSRIL